MFNPNILADYASLPNPQKDLPSNVYLTHDDATLTIYDLFAKAKFHFLILPHIPFLLPDSPPGSTIPSRQLSSLSSCLQSPHAKQVLIALKAASERVVQIVKERMMKDYGFWWDVQVGFHAVPSMNHLHLHVISSDLVSPALKNKKHFLSFHPAHGFFIPISEIIELIEDGQKHLPRSPSTYESLLKSPLECHICGEEQKNIPRLKEHLEEEWERGEGKRGTGSDSIVV